MNIHLVIFFTMFHFLEGKEKTQRNEKSSLGPFLCMIIMQARMSTRWRQLSIFSTNQQESASFAPKKGLNSGTRIVLCSCCEQNCEHQFHHALILILSCSYLHTHTHTLSFVFSVFPSFPKCFIFP